MKLHLRLVKVRGNTFRLVTLRPETSVAFSTNYFHETWHILSDAHGARLLARLMWGLSYQRQPGTIIVIHGEHIKPTPFGAERSDPIALLPPGLTKQDAKTLRQLFRQLKHLGPSQSTVRWHTFGLDQALSEWQEKYQGDLSVEVNDPLHHWQEKRRLWHAEQMFRRGGFVCYSAPPEIMRSQSLIISQMQTDDYEMDYHYLSRDKGNCWPDGEVQIFDDYHARLAAAAQARQQVFQRDNLPTDSLQLYEIIAVHREEILRRRKAGRSSPKAV